MNSKGNSTRPFGIADKLGYMFGDFGNDFTFLLSSAFLMKFYTDVMGVSAGVVGIMMMAARIANRYTYSGTDLRPEQADGKGKIRAVAAQNVRSRGSSFSADVRFLV